MPHDDPSTPSPTLLSWFRDEAVWGLSLSSIALAVAAALGVYLAITLLLGVAQRRSRRIAEGRAAAGGGKEGAGGVAAVVADVLGGTSHLLILLVALLVGVGMLDLAPRWQARVGQLWFIALALQMALWGTRAIGIAIRRYEARHLGAPSLQVSASGTLMSWGLRTLLWATIALAMLANLGVNITAFVASLGVGGIAIALAVQNVLGDLFASLAIAVDKPFEVGDFIVVGGVAGTVQRIGVKTTRIRSLGGEQVVMSNTDLLKQTINNYRYLQERRIVFNFTVSYTTTAPQAEAVAQAVRRIIEAQEKVRFDRAHLKAFGANALEYEVVYIVLDPGFNAYMDVQQSINLALMRELESLGVQFGVPVRTVHMVAPAEAALPETPAMPPKESR
ncbi:mechanosensitive ion channel family protein [Acidovorax sp. NCPPB 4044]|uniref:mechanosensitive ion channel family protein n=1 Tax=Acidovorax sp. NCPPB 4044 TaxID=2940490 RepID=UPI0023034240|nr:mechanosensitive ion channel family protein [Acidovorax sp. NCPPB 4044]MDA8523556.1 mechanosensitive ion channel family protein [Acidovorax sp. NCPPB 4044]